MSVPPPFEPHLAWSKGGHARLLTLEGEAVSLRSTTPAPPGARLEADLVAPGEAPAKVKLKSHGSRRDEDGTFVIKGRLVDATRELRGRLGDLVARAP